jgi:hypothetical protein
MNQKLPKDQILIGPLRLYYNDCFENLIINDKTYKYDRHGNITGYKHCLLSYDSNLDLEEIGFWDKDNHCVIEWHFGYSYFTT